MYNKIIEKRTNIGSLYLFCYILENILFEQTTHKKNNDIFILHILLTIKIFERF